MIRRLLGIVSASLLLISVAHADEPTTGDFASKVVDTVYRWKGGAGSPLEEKLRLKLEELSRAEQGGGAGGFEPPPDDPAGPPTADDDGQFNALISLMEKMTPLERVKAGVWFLIIRPRTTHRDEVMGMINKNAGALTSSQQADFRDYMETRKSLSAASYGNRVDRWQRYAKEKPQSTFSDLAKREVQHIRSLQQDASTDRKKGAGRFLVKVGIVAIVLALVAVIVFGAAR